MLRQFPVMSTPLSREIGRDLVLQLGPEADPGQLMTIHSEAINGLLEIVEATEAVFFGIFRCAKSCIDEGCVTEMRVQPHSERLGRYALVRLRGRSELPAAASFREFARALFRE
jgi:hypothetical protein